MRATPIIGSPQLKTMSMRQVEVVRGHALGPGREIGRGPHLDGDAHLLQLAADVLGDVLLLVVAARQVVDRQLEAAAVGTGLVAGRVEHLGRLLEVVG